MGSAAAVEREASGASLLLLFTRQAETLRSFIAALLFPVVVWLTQWVLQRVLGL